MSNRAPEEQRAARPRRGVRVEALLALAFGTLLAVALIEGVGRAYFSLHPAYDVIFLEPDRSVGWKLAPNLRFTWTGNYGYAADFSVEVQANSLGFRDLERTVDPPAGTTRIALLGDSMVEALQVPLEKTAGQQLERRLNAGFAASRSPSRFEVLNFGVSSYSVGQYLLVWEEYANRFGPRYVLAFVSPMQMKRTPQAAVKGGFSSTQGKRLRARPTFELREGELVRTPAADFDEFVALQERVIREEFGGSRMRRKDGGLVGHSVIATLWRNATGWRRAAPGGGRGARAASPRRGGRSAASAPTLLDLNLRILEELGRQVESAGGQLVIVGEREVDLRGFSDEHGFGYIPLGRHLARASRDGERIDWQHDIHYNELGNQVFADAMYPWLIQALRRGAAPGPAAAGGS